MPIERNNSFHLLLSDDELKLLRLLAEQEGLTASDYLRTMLRRMPAVPSPLMHAIKVDELLGARGAGHQLLERSHAAMKVGTKAARKVARKQPTKKKR